MDLLRILIAIFLPPLGVFLQVGFGGGILVKHSSDSARLHPWNSARCLDYSQALKL